MPPIAIYFTKLSWFAEHVQDQYKHFPTSEMCVCERERERKRGVIFFTPLLAFIRLYHQRNCYIRQLKVINIVGYQDVNKPGNRTSTTTNKIQPDAQ
jgi:hypothetical protein